METLDMEIYNKYGILTKLCFYWESDMVVEYERRSKFGTWWLSVILLQESLGHGDHEH